MKLFFTLFLSPFLLGAQTVTSVELVLDDPRTPALNIVGTGFTSTTEVRVAGTTPTSVSISPTLIHAAFDTSRLSTPTLAMSIASGNIFLQIGYVLIHSFSFAPAPDISYAERPNGGSQVQIVGSRIDSNVRMTVFCGSARREITSFQVRPGVLSYTEPVCEQDSYAVSLGVPINALGTPLLPTTAPVVRITGMNYSKPVGPPAKPFPSTGELFLSGARITVTTPSGPGPTTHTVEVEGKNFNASTRILVNGALVEAGEAELARTPQRLTGRFTSTLANLSAAPTVGLFVTVGVTATASNFIYSDPFGFPRLDAVTMLSPVEFRATGQHLDNSRFLLHCGPASVIEANVVRRTAEGPVFATSGCPMAPAAGFPLVVASRNVPSLWPMGTISSSAVALPRATVSPTSVTLSGNLDSAITASLTVSAPMPTRFRVAVGVPWLTATPSSGTTPATVELRATNAAEGTFSGNVDVVFESSSGSSTITVPVTLRAAGRPVLLSLPYVPEMLWRRGDAVPVLQMPVLGDTAAAAVPFTIEQKTGQTWVTAVNPAMGAPAVVNFRVTPEQLGVGEHVASFVLRAPQSRRPETEFSVLLRVVDARAPLATPLRILTAAGSPDTTRLLPLPSPAATSFTVETVGEVPWLSHPRGSFRGNTAVPLTISPGSLAPGVYFADLKASASTAPRELPQRLELVVAGSTPALTAAQGKVLVQLTEPNSAGAAEPVAVWPESAAWSLRTRVLTPATGDWLQARRVGSSVAITTTPMPAGRYFGAVDVVGTDGTAQTITVELQAPTGFDAGPLAAPAGLIVAEEGGAAETLRIVLPEKAPAGVVQAVALNGAGPAWLSVVSATVQKARDEAGSIQVRADPARLSPGVYQATLVVGGGAGLQYWTPITMLVRRGGAGRFLCRESADALAAVLVLPPGNRAGALPLPGDLPVGVRLVDPCGEAVTPASGVAQSVNVYNHGDNGVYALTHDRDGLWTGVIPAASGVQLEVQAHVLRPSGTLQSTDPAAPRWVESRRVPENESAPWLQGVAGVATGSPLNVLSPGAMASVFGRAMAAPSARTAASGGELPETLEGAAVYLGGQRLRLQYASAQQVNLLVPLDYPVGTVAPLVVEWNGRRSAPWPVVMAGAIPAILQSGNQGAILLSGAPVVVGPRGQSAFGLESRPARAGDALTIYATGLGVVTNPPAYGSAASTSPPFSTVTGPLKVKIDGQETPMLFAGLSPGFTGLYQVNVLVPSGARVGSIPIQLDLGGLVSPPIQIVIE